MTQCSDERASNSEREFREREIFFVAQLSFLSAKQNVDKTDLKAFADMKAFNVEPLLVSII